MKKLISRRRILGVGVAGLAGSFALNQHRANAQTSDRNLPPGNTKSGRSYWEKSYSGGSVDLKPLAPTLPGKDYSPVVVPNGAALPFKIFGGVKVFHLAAEEIDHAFDPGLRAKCWGFNGRVNGTVIEALEGERVRIYVTNRLPVATSIHWHGDEHEHDNGGTRK